ncbi:MAG: DUF4292 domain-containing protein [Oligoflexia bacterium]|nr:DUF4292 domain-containing protein [Oligoflexia bacterium]
MNLPGMVLRQILIASLWFALVACAPIAVWRPQGHFVESATVRSYQEAIRTSNPDIPFGRLLYRAKLTHGHEVLGFRYALVFQGNSRVRLETLPVNGAYALALLAYNNGQVMLLDTQAKTFAESSDTRAAIVRALHVPLDIGDLLHVVSGRLPLSLRKADVTGGQRGEGLLLVAADGLTRAEVDTVASRLRAIQFIDQFRDYPALEVQFGEFTDLQQASIPRHVTFHLLSDDATLELELVGSNLEATPKDGLFQVQIPADYSRTSF